MALDNPFPNATPPRRSSHGLGNGFPSAAKPLTKPVPEGIWIGQCEKLQTTSSYPSQPPGSDPPPESSNGNGPYTGGTTWSAEKEKILFGPYDYMVDQPGKDMRKQLIAAFNAWLQVPPDSLAIITKVVGMLHTSSLLYVRPIGLLKEKEIPDMTEMI